MSPSYPLRNWRQTKETFLLERNKHNNQTAKVGVPDVTIILAMLHGLKGKT